MRLGELRNNQSFKFFLVFFGVSLFSVYIVYGEPERKLSRLLFTAFLRPPAGGDRR
jgi:hypothetical protein